MHIRAATADETKCLVRELAKYSPRRSHHSVLIELGEASQTDLLALLSAIETCLVANEIRSLRLEVDGEEYLLPRQ